MLASAYGAKSERERMSFFAELKLDWVFVLMETVAMEFDSIFGDPE